MGVLNYIRQKKNEFRAKKIGRYAEESQYNEKEQIAELKRIEKEKMMVRRDRESIQRMRSQARGEKLRRLKKRFGKARSELKSMSRSSSSPFSPGKSETSGVFSGGGRNPFYDEPKPKPKSKTVTIKIER